MSTPVMTVEEVERFLAAEFPQAFHPQSGLTIEKVWLGGCRIRLAYSDKFIRPGGTISGPTMMTLSDFALYVAVLAAIGPVALAVTINLNINFLRKPERSRPHCRGENSQAWQALGGDGGEPLFGRQRRASGACDVDLFDSASQLRLLAGNTAPIL